MNRAVRQPEVEINSQVCIVGFGAQTPVGLNGPSAAAAIRAGIPGFVEHPYIISRQGEPMIVAKVLHFDADALGVNRFRSLVIEPAREALTPVSAHRGEVGPISLFLGLPPARPGRPPDLEEQLTDLLRHELNIASVEFIAAGHAAGLIALEAVSRRIAARSSEFCLIGGVDSYLEADTLEWLEENDQLHGGDNAYGFIPGEAAGFCLVCSRQAAHRANLRVLAQVQSVATARETKLIKTESVCIGKGLTEALQKVFTGLPSPSAKIDHTICDMNGEPYRADEYGFAVARLSQHFVGAADFVAPADCWGDVGAASGPLFVGLVVAAGQRGYAHARHNLIWASSESGERSAAILRYEQVVGN